MSEGNSYTPEFAPKSSQPHLQDLKANYSEGAARLGRNVRKIADHTTSEIPGVKSTIRKIEDKKIEATLSRSKVEAAGDDFYKDAKKRIDLLTELDRSVVDAVNSGDKREIEDAKYRASQKVASSVWSELRTQNPDKVKELISKDPSIEGYLKAYEERNKYRPAPTGRVIGEKSQKKAPGVVETNQAFDQIENAEKSEPTEEELEVALREIQEKDAQKIKDELSEIDEADFPEQPTEDEFNPPTEPEEESRDDQKEMEGDPEYQRMRTEAALDFLNTEDKEWFRDRFPNPIPDSEGYLTDKNGKKFAVLQNIGPGDIQKIDAEAKRRYEAHSIIKDEESRDDGKVEAGVDDVPEDKTGDRESEDEKPIEDRIAENASAIVQAEQEWTDLLISDASEDELKELSEKIGDLHMQKRDLLIERLKR